MRVTAKELEKEAHWIACLESSPIIHYFDENKKEIGCGIKGFPNFGMRISRELHYSFLDKLIWTRIHKPSPFEDSIEYHQSFA